MTACLILLLVTMGTLMASRKLPAALALPALGLLIALLAGLSQGLPWVAPDGSPSLRLLLFDRVMLQGSTTMAKAMVAAMLAGMLAQVILHQGIAQAIVGVVSEYAGDRKGWLAVLMLLAVAVNFTSLTGVGAIMMLGTLILPVLVSNGLSPTLSGSIMLLGIALGGMLNPLALQVYLDAFSLSLEDCRYLALQQAAVLLVVCGLYLVRQFSTEKVYCWAHAPENPKVRVNASALLTPALPLILMWLPGLQLPVLPSLALAAVYGCLTTRPGQTLRTLHLAFVDGIREVAPVLALFVGLGMTLSAMTDPLCQPLLRSLLPASPLTPWQYCLAFSLLAPFALYRGPLTLYGLGAGFAVLLAQANILPAIALFLAFLALGQLQNVCDPTCTHTVCIAQILKLPTERFLFHLLPYLWLFLVLALFVAVTMQGAFADVRSFS